MAMVCEKRAGWNRTCSPLIVNLTNAGIVIHLADASARWRTEAENCCRQLTLRHRWLQQSRIKD
jgi:hypothetical protein